MKPGDMVFLSASVPTRKEWVPGSDQAEIQQAIVSIARAVFSRGGRLLFGGHPSISPLIADIAGEYYTCDPERKTRPIVTFQSKLYEGKLPDQTWLLFRMGWSAIEWIDNVDDDKDKSLELMRRTMLMSQAPPPVAMFAVGGMDGVREEALIFLEARNDWPIHSTAKVFALTSGGGASQRFFSPQPEWQRSLWPDKPMNPRDQAALSAAIRKGDLVSVEQSWESKHPDALSPEMPFKPYGVMTQWVLDEVIDGSF